MSTYGNVQPQVLRNWGREDADSTATALFYFNSAQRILARSHNFKELQKSKTFNFTLGDYTYSLVSSPISLTDLRQIYSWTYVSSSQGYNMLYIDPKKWDLEVAPQIPTAGNSYPKWYTRWGNDLTIFPPPNSTYANTLKYLAEPTPAVDTGTAIDFVGMDEVLVLLTTALCFYSVEDFESGDKYMKQAALLGSLYGVEAETSRDHHLSQSRSNTGASGQYWNDPFVRGIRG